MDVEEYVQQTSLTKRLKVFLFIFAFFFLFTSAGLYLASLRVLSGITEINQTNEVLERMNQSLEGLDSATQNVEKLFFGKDVADARFAFFESLKQTKRFLEEAIQKEGFFPARPKYLLAAQEGLKHYENVLVELFGKFPDTRRALNRAEIQIVNRDLLIAKQYELEVRESFRNAQIVRTSRSEGTFNEVYVQRNRPLYVGIGLALFFFALVILVGRNITQRLERSIKNLSTATDAVSRLDLSYRAPILESDEFGELTYEFNQMVAALEEGRKRLRLTVDRITRLQEITAALSVALKPDEVWEIVVKQGFEATGAQAGIVALVSEDKTKLELKRMEGYQEEVREKWKYMPIELNLPLTDALKKREPIWLESRNDFREKYPDFDVPSGKPRPSFAAIPLVAGDQVYGVLGLNFSEDREFNEDERKFIMAFTRLCAQALFRAQLYDDAQKAIQTRDEFLSIASHELRTPLTPLKLQLQGFARQVKSGNYREMPPERLMKLVESSDKQVSRLASLIEDLLDVSRINTGRLNLNKEVMNLSDLMSDIMVRYGHQLANVQCVVKTNIDKDVYGLLDRLRIEQVVVNLLTNAAKYAAGKTVIVSLEQKDDRGRITVKDEGPGIALEDQKRIFERFERVKTRDNIGGLGLGLYISRQIIEAHGGKIFVESEPGKGAAFIVEIPLKTEQLSSFHPPSNRISAAN